MTDDNVKAAIEGLRWENEAFFGRFGKDSGHMLFAIATIEALAAENERYRESIEQIDNWAKAYPLEVFPEPDFGKVNAALHASGISLSAVSASNMRHVIESVKNITKTALIPPESTDQSEAPVPQSAPPE